MRGGTPLAATLLTAVTVCAAEPAAAEVRHGSFRSRSLGREVAYAVQLPPSYAAGKGLYPVLYVLHGLFEGPAFWEERGLPRIVEELWKKGELPEMIVVAPDGDNSFFVDGPLGAYETLVVRDVVEHAESAYRARPGRDGRALLGISMGGYAALRMALSRPEMYGAVAAHSAVVLPEIPTAAAGARSGHLLAFQRAFGDPIDSRLWAASDPLSWAGKADPGRTPALYFDCGSEDRYGLFRGNEELHRRLQARGVAHTFALRPGNHGYEYVRSVLAYSLKFIGVVMGQPPPRDPEARRAR
jgi:S-formylglutathione hydrolase FrmB